LAVRLILPRPFGAPDTLTGRYADNADVSGAGVVVCDLAHTATPGSPVAGTTTWRRTTC